MAIGIPAVKSRETAAPHMPLESCLPFFVTVVSRKNLNLFLVCHTLWSTNVGWILSTSSSSVFFFLSALKKEISNFFTQIRWTRKE